VFHSIEKQVADAFHAHIQVRYGVDLSVTIEQPRQSDFGEIAVRRRSACQAIAPGAEEIAAELAAESGRYPAWRRSKWRVTAISIFARPRRLRSGAVAGRRRRYVRRRGKIIVGAHQHQSQQGGAHRPPAQRHAG